MDLEKQNSKEGARVSWRASFAPPTEEEEQREKKRIAKAQEERSTRLTLLAVRRKSSVSGAAPPRRTRLDTFNSDSEVSFSELSIGGTRRRKKEKRKKQVSKSSSPPLAKKSTKGLRYHLGCISQSLLDLLISLSPDLMT